ncbi:hypothetical protein [Staphylococcus saprophyticus]|uniref:hypothetical protein n=1 Tax=Staphylococcus saprophyticus TaxID=29385 RepID=UPI00297B4D4A|nr:hypothetical protein [Staphylococcus saprophyticus]
MVKIKQKKQLNLPQLIEWLLKSGYRNYTANSNMGNIVTLSRYGAIQFSLGTFFPEETFTVEVEEEIDEDTVFEEILLIVNNGLGIEVYSNYSINDVLSNNEGYYEETVMLILKPDPEVIWTREKGLVE